VAFGYTAAGGSMNRWTGALLCMLLLTALGGGCGAARDDRSADAHRQSAEALFEFIVELSERPVPDAETFYSLVFWETPKQELWRYFAENQILPHYRFMKACHDRFGKSVNSGVVSFVKLSSLRILTNDGERAHAVCQTVLDGEAPLHLVKIGEHWHISGYTFELNPRLMFDDDKGHEFMCTSLFGIAAYYEPVIEQARRGDFRTIDDAMSSFVAARDQWYRDHSRMY
jgi:hypothetical protein